MVTRASSRLSPRSRRKTRSRRALSAAFRGAHASSVLVTGSSRHELSFGIRKPRSANSLAIEPGWNYPRFSRSRLTQIILWRLLPKICAICVNLRMNSWCCSRGSPISFHPIERVCGFLELSEERWEAASTYCPFALDLGNKDGIMPRREGKSRRNAG